jgi:putative flippase GtrA
VLPSSIRFRSWIAVVTRQLAWFAGIGTVATLVYLALYAGLRLFLGAQAANAVAWVLTAGGNTAANRRLTFGVHGRPGEARAQVEALATFAVGWAITSASLFALEQLAPEPGQALELTVLAVSNLVAGVVRFLLLRYWVFAAGRRASGGGPDVGAPDGGVDTGHEVVRDVRQ